MQVLIIEDEALGAQRLADILYALDATIVVVGCIESIHQGVEWFNRNASPDLIFLDIELTDGQSFELFKEVKISCPVIFTTSYNEYALKAFELNSIDYLLKPIRREQVQRSLDKYKQMKQIMGVDMQQLQRLLQPLSKPTDSFRTRFLVKYGQKHLSVAIQEIAYFLGEDKVVFLVTHKKDKYVIDYTLDELEHLLDPAVFYRANRSFIVHADAVKSVGNESYGKLRLHLLPIPAKDVVVSRDKASAFKAWLGK
jgi:DNA-binding LytR/AlgR family response regulator